MHGVHIAGDLISTARKQGKVRKASIEVGEIANITKQDLTKALFDLADFKFEIKEKKALVKCSCGYKGSPRVIGRQHDLVLFECPQCHHKPTVLEGDKIILKEVEI